MTQEEAENAINQYRAGQATFAWLCQYVNVAFSPAYRRLLDKEEKTGINREKLSLESLWRVLWPLEGQE